MNNDLLTNATFDRITKAIDTNCISALTLIVFARQERLFENSLYRMWFLSLLGKNLENSIVSTLIERSKDLGVDNIDEIIHSQLNLLNIKSGQDISKVYSFLGNILVNGHCIDPVILDTLYSEGHLKPYAQRFKQQNNSNIQSKKVVHIEETKELEL